MQFKDIMNMMLPPIRGVSAHITPPGDFGAGAAQGRVPPSTIPHRGVDMNYVGGQSGINLTHPDVHSPVSGTVTKAGGGRYNAISITDMNGNSHHILHTQDQYVSTGQKVFAGDPIGTMGNTGTKDQHVHYHMFDSAGNLVNPRAFWDQYLPEYQKYVEAIGASAGNAPNVLSPDVANAFVAPRARYSSPVPYLDRAPDSQQLSNSNAGRQPDNSAYSRFNDRWDEVNQLNQNRWPGDLRALTYGLDPSYGLGQLGNLSAPTNMRLTSPAAPSPFDTGAPSVPFVAANNPPAPAPSTSFNDRFGSFDPPSLALRQLAQQPQYGTAAPTAPKSIRVLSSRFPALNPGGVALGNASSPGTPNPSPARAGWPPATQPLPDYPVPPSVYGLPDPSAGSMDDWFDRWIKPLLQQ